MMVLHSNPRALVPRAAAAWPAGLRATLAARPGHLVAAVLALAPLLLANCTDDVAANCPPLAHPEVLTVAAAAGDPCAANKGEPAALLALARASRPATEGSR